MSIIEEQNILGNPDLAGASRPGSNVSIADYSFATASMEYEKNTYVMMGTDRGGNWTAPTSYAGEVAQAEVEGESPIPQTGIAGDSTQSSPTQYGGPGGAPLPENATQTTNLTQVAEVLAEEKMPDLSLIPNPMASSLRSELITEEGSQGPMTSGGHFNGNDSVTPYPAPPVVIENTGLKQGDLFSAAIAEASESANPGSDNPQAGRGSGGDRDLKRPAPRDKTVGVGSINSESDRENLKKKTVNKKKSFRVHKLPGGMMGRPGMWPDAASNPSLDQSDRDS